MNVNVNVNVNVRSSVKSVQDSQLLRCGRQRTGNRFRQPVPARGFLAQLPAPGRRQPVVLGAPVVVGRAPFRFNPALLFEPDEGGVERALIEFERIAAGDKTAGPIAQLEIAERFRWLTAVRSSVIQTSRPHPGLCAHPEEKVEQLFRELVL